MITQSEAQKRIGSTRSSAIVLPIAKHGLSGIVRGITQSEAQKRSASIRAGQVVQLIAKHKEGFDVRGSIQSEAQKRCASHLAQAAWRPKAKQRGLLLKVLLALALFLAAMAAFAQAVPVTAASPRVTFPMTASGNTLTLGPVSATSANAPNFSFAPAANGGIYANTATRLPTPNGGALVANVAGNIGKAEVGRAIGRFAAKMLAPLVVGMALYDLYKELGFGVDSKGVATTSGSSCSAEAGCYYEMNGCRGATPTETALCDMTNHGGTRYEDTYMPELISGGHYYYYYNGNTYKGSGGLYLRGSLTPTTAPTTNQEFLDALAAKSGWPASSSLARTLADALKADPTLAVRVDPATLSGPLADPIPSIETKNDPATDTKTVTETKTKFDYSPTSPSVTMTKSVTETKTILSTGAPIGEPVTTTSTAPVPNVPTDPTEAPPPPEPPKDPCEGKPLRLGCADMDVPAGEIPKVSKTITYTPDSLGFGSGTCPADIVLNQARGMVFSYAPACTMLAGPVKLLVLAAAALTAFFIVAGVRVES